MDKVKGILVLEEELENLREKLNKDVIKNIRNTSVGAYKNLLDISIKLDDVIVNYMKSYNK